MQYTFVFYNIECFFTNLKVGLAVAAHTSEQQVTSNKYLLLMVPVCGTWQKSQESAGAI